MATLVDRLVSLVSTPGAALPGPNHADGQPVIIEDLEGSELFQLDGADIPEQGVAVGGKLRSTVTRYPGSSKVSMQIMGTQDEPIEVRGWFRDAWTGLNGGAAAQFAALLALWRRQHHCELSWGSLLVRRGYVEQVEATITSERAIQYRIVFLVTEADEKAVVATPFPAAETPFDLLALLAEISASIDDVVSASLLINTAARAVT